MFSYLVLGLLNARLAREKVNLGDYTPRLMTASKVDSHYLITLLICYFLITLLSEDIPLRLRVILKCSVYRFGLAWNPRFRKWRQSSRFRASLTHAQPLSKARGRIMRMLIKQTRLVNSLRHVFFLYDSPEILQIFGRDPWAR